MIEDEAFRGRTGAHLWYAATLPSADGERVLMRHLAEGTWQEAPERWFGCAQFIGNRADGSPRELEFLERWFAVVVAGEITDAVHASLHRGITQLLSVGVDIQPFVAQLGDWFCQRARPGHANICADLIGWISAYDRRNREAGGRGAEPYSLPAESFPLVEWLLMNGAAELRTQQRAGLLSVLLDAVHAHGPPALLEVALGYLLVAEGALQGWSWARPRGQWPVVEAALEGGAGGALVGEVVRRLLTERSAARERIWTPLSSPGEFPLSSAALLRELCAGRLPENDAEEAWRLVVGTELPKEAPQFATPTAVEAALKGLHWQIVRERRDLMPSEAAWAEHMVQSQLRIRHVFGAGGAPPDAIALIEQQLGWQDDVTKATHRALLDELPSGDEWDLTRRLLTAPAAILSRVTHAALSSIPRRGQPQAVEGVNLDPLALEFTRILNLPWVEAVFGVPLTRVWSGCTRVVFEPLTDSDKVVVRGPELALDRGYYAEVMASGRDPEEALGLCTLYFFHEVIHLWQGIGAYDAVQRLRSTGAEMTLMHVDLAADHAAALMASRATPRWSLTWLKDLASRSLVHFPAGPLHTDASRHRKAVRLVSHRLDLLARQLGAVPDKRLGDSYLFADYGPAGGHLLVLGSGPPPWLVTSAPLDPDQATFLSQAADEHTDPSAFFEALDAILRAALNQIR